MQVRDTPQGEFVNLFLNGKYNGLYFLSQRPREGGSVHIQKLDNQILKVNGRTKPPQVVEDDEEDDDSSAAGELSSAGTSGTGTASAGTSSPDRSSSGTSSGIKKSELPKRIALHKEGERLKKWGGVSWDLIVIFFIKKIVL